jgi:hypothetical protein
MIQIKKDKQEAAIYIFTIVTVIFLPLSFVTGFLGMNTSDMRNMTTNQWIYWATAIPLTVVVIVVALYLSGELQTIFSWSSQFSDMFWNKWRFRGLSATPNSEDLYPKSSRPATGYPYSGYSTLPPPYLALTPPFGLSSPLPLHEENYPRRRNSTHHSSNYIP